MSDLPHILITGVTGFIGQVLAKQLEGRAVIHAIVRSPGNTGLNEIVHNLSDPLPSSKLPSRIDTVLHMAQSPNYRNFPEDGPEVFAVNVRAMSDLLDYAVTAGAKSFVHCSTGSVYEPYSGVLREDRTLSPTSLNGTTKLAAEAISRTYEAQFAVSRLRFFMPYGPGQRDKLLPAIIDRIQRGQAVDLQGGTGPHLSPIHVHDAAALIIRAALENWTGAYNIASPEYFTLADIAERIAVIMGAELRVNITEGVPPRLVPETDRLAKACPDYEFVPFAEGLTGTVQSQIGDSRAA